MKIYSFYIGIDVSKLKLDINILNPITMIGEHLVINNTLKDVNLFIKLLIKKGIDTCSILFCCENTGNYTNHLMYALLDLKLDLWIVPAIEIKRAKGLVRGKSDKIDARDIAVYSLKNQEKIRLTEVIDQDISKLKLLYTEREKMVKSLLIMESTSESKSFLNKEVFKEVVSINLSLINKIKKSIFEIERKIKQIIKSNEKLNKQSELIKTIPGIGEQTSIYLIIATKGFTSFSSWRKFACYCGIAPFEYSSGSSIKGRTKVSHIADKKMKSLLQMCAMTSIKHDSQMKEYYNKKRNEGKNAMLVLNNVRCKLISRVFAVIMREKPFIDTYKFAS
jgi:transposase